MKSSDPHKNDLIDIKSSIEAGWFAYAIKWHLDLSSQHYYQLQSTTGIACQITIDSNDKPIDFPTVFTPVEICKNAHLKVENVYFNETFYTVYLTPPYDGID